MKTPNITSTLPRIAAVTLVAGSFLGVGSAALAQGAADQNAQPAPNAQAAPTAHTPQNASQTTLTIQASRFVQHKVVGSAYAGVPLEQVSLSRQLSYADLNLHTPQGVAALKARIRLTAMQACQQLTSLYPFDQWAGDTQTCVQNAIQSWMPQVHAAVAAADQPNQGALR